LTQGYDEISPKHMHGQTQIGGLLKIPVCKHAMHPEYRHNLPQQLCKEFKARVQ